MKQKVCKNTTEFGFCWSVVLGMGPILEIWLTDPVRLHWGKQHFPLQVVSFTDSSWLSVGACAHFPLSVLGLLTSTPIGSGLVATILCELIHMLVLLCLESTVSLESSPLALTVFPPLPPLPPPFPPLPFPL